MVFTVDTRVLLAERLLPHGLPSQEAHPFLANRFHVNTHRLGANGTDLGASVV